MTRKQQRFFRVERELQWQQVHQLAKVQGAGLHQVSGPHWRHIWWWRNVPYVISHPAGDQFVAKTVGARVTLPNHR